MTVHQRTALRVAGILFGIWLLLAIADFPPPPGFAIVLLVLLACALLVYLRVPVYLRWQAEGANGRILRVARDGLLGGGAIALLSLLSPGEPSVQPGLSDRMIGISVLTGLGIGNALVVGRHYSSELRSRHNVRRPRATRSGDEVHRRGAMRRPWPWAKVAA
jgi:hypothetical protein